MAFTDLLKAARQGVHEPRGAWAAMLKNVRGTPFGDGYERIGAALEEISVWAARERVEQAEAALRDARAREPKRLMAKVLGNASATGPTVEEAEQALSDAKTSLDVAQRTRDALESQQRAAEAELSWAKSGLKTAIARVIHSEGGANAVLAQYMEARREVARLHEV